MLRLSFAHPLHGSVIASCSPDRTVRIWEEPAGPSSSKDGRWVERGILGGANGSVRSVEFSPPSPTFGLRVVRSDVQWRTHLTWQASIATDSHLRIHTSLDPDLNDWSSVHDVHVSSLPGPGDSEEQPPREPSNPDAQAKGGWGLSWCREKWWGSVIAVFAGTSPLVKVRHAFGYE